MKVNNKTNISFKAGLTPQIVGNAARYTAANLERSFDQIGIKADFQNNRAIAYCCGVVSDIFDVLTKKFNLPFGSKPPSITAFKDSELLDFQTRGCYGFCIPDSMKIIDGKGMYETNSVFYSQNWYPTLTAMNDVAEDAYNTHHNSTNHFLHTIIHEWVHNIHNDILYRNFGYDGTCPKTLQKYNQLNGSYYDPNPYVSGIQHKAWMNQFHYTPEQREIIKNEISNYAAGERGFNGQLNGGNPFELVAETVTKDIVNVLDPQTLMPTANPFLVNGHKDNRFIKILNDAWLKMSGG